MQQLVTELLNFEAECSPSVSASFFVWRSFGNATLPDVEALPSIWRHVMMAFASPRDNSMTTDRQTALLASVSSLDPAAPISDKRFMWTPDMPFLSWMDSPLAEQKLMLSLQLLLLSASSLARHPSVFCGVGMTASDPAQIKIVDQVNPQIQYAQQQHHALCLGQSGHAVVLLRSALLLLKLIGLTSAVSDMTHTQKAFNALWKAVHLVSSNLDVHNHSKCPSPKDCQPTGPGPMQEAAEEMHLSQVILPVLLSLMKQDIKQGGQHLRAAWLLLLAMMFKKGPLSQAITAAFLAAGQLCSACCSSHSTPIACGFTKQTLLLPYCSRHAHLLYTKLCICGRAAIVGMLKSWAWILIQPHLSFH